MRKLTLSITLSIAFAMLAVQAQFIRWASGKTTTIRVDHPPSVGLMVKRVAFGQPSGECALELVDTVIKPEFSKNQVEVIDRQNLDQILSEHNFNQSVYADAQSVAKLGKILGPSALIVVKVYDCRTERQALVDNSQKDFNGLVHTLYISKTRASLKGSIEIVDLTTGQSLGARQFEAHPDKAFTSEAGQPEYPADFEVKNLAMQQAGEQVSQIFFPWVESEEYVFYDDKDCGLKDAWEILQRGDHKSALVASERNLAQCRGAHKKDKSLARAAYNLGMGYFINGDYDKALESFREAMQTKGAEAVVKASAGCERAKQLSTQLAAYRERVARIPAPTAVVAAVKETPPPESVVPPRPPQPPPPSTANAAPPVEERLKKLDGLLKKGLINRQDYEKKKTEILKDI